LSSIKKLIFRSHVCYEFLFYHLDFVSLVPDPSENRQTSDFPSSLLVRFLVRLRVLSSGFCVFTVRFLSRSGLTIFLFHWISVCSAGFGPVRCPLLVRTVFHCIQFLVTRSVPSVPILVSIECCFGSDPSVPARIFVPPRSQSKHTELSLFPSLFWFVACPEPQPVSSCPNPYFFNLFWCCRSLGGLV
jgi:hypothetical protein